MKWRIYSINNYTCIFMKISKSHTPQGVSEKLWIRIFVFTFSLLKGCTGEKLISWWILLRTPLHYWRFVLQGAKINKDITFIFAEGHRITISSCKFLFEICRTMLAHVYNSALFQEFQTLQPKQTNLITKGRKKWRAWSFSSCELLKTCQTNTQQGVSWVAI